MAADRVRVGYPQISGLRVSGSGSNIAHGFAGSDTRNISGLGRIFNWTRGAPLGPRKQ